MDWIELAQNMDMWWALVTAVMNLRVPLNEGNFLTSWEPIIFSRMTLLHGISKYVSTYFEDRTAIANISIVDNSYYWKPTMYSCWAHLQYGHEEKRFSTLKQTLTYPIYSSAFMEPEGL